MEVGFYDWLKEYLKRQRHDEFNRYQVLHAYLKLGRSKEALDYLDLMVEIAPVKKELSKLYSLPLQEALLDIYLDAQKKGIKLILDIESSACNVDMSSSSNMKMIESLKSKLSQFLKSNLEGKKLEIEINEYDNRIEIELPMEEMKWEFFVKDDENVCR